MLSEIELNAAPPLSTAPEPSSTSSAFPSSCQEFENKGNSPSISSFVISDSEFFSSSYASPSASSSPDNASTGPKSLPTPSFSPPPAASSFESAFSQPVAARSSPSATDSTHTHTAGDWSTTAFRDSNSIRPASDHPYEYPPTSFTTVSSSEREYRDEGSASTRSRSLHTPSSSSTSSPSSGTLTSSPWSQILSKWPPPSRLFPALMVLGGNMYPTAETFKSNKVAFAAGLVTAVGMFWLNIRPPPKGKEDESKKVVASNSDAPSTTIEESQVLVAEPNSVDLEADPEPDHPPTIRTGNIFAGASQFNIHDSTFISTAHGFNIHNANFDPHSNVINVYNPNITRRQWRDEQEGGGPSGSAVLEGKKKVEARAEE
ncbi:hypothetical protein GYMLUDRAFT_46699 [Collybiopsis luxurians FD-317 M1]|uniref:Unplaced genomic scaffold GYMLUscaffold_45, whole genome shotgun sequence n=1 Tax=Collybiopsis luxurians FD-317 M1 TaxID=944289 RepID=A0A0D0BPT3_9AGAR|nr:hypothetical protein GYMLUDRAFT_46699 [Collybiopsis luxurians FD-317 M1]